MKSTVRDNATGEVIDVNIVELAAKSGAKPPVIIEFVRRGTVVIAVTAAELRQLVVEKG